MTSDLVGIENDQSQIIIDRAERALNERGVILHEIKITPVGAHTKWMGMANRRLAICSFQSLKDLSEEQIQEKASEIIKEVESKIRAGGDDVQQ